jgi:phosphoribosylaminoimidazolecarboxamide formyltransferase/IMP cyclohydrolase
MEVRVRRALVSVSDKTGVVEFVRQLQEMGVEIISTGGTAKSLSDAGLKVIGISDVTGFPEMLEGRVKTLHPAVHGGILADRTKPDHMQTIENHGIKPIDMVVVNLYPFAQTVAKPGVTLEDAVENIDIGGPSMVRSAAKNFAAVAIVVDPNDYAVVLDEIRRSGGVAESTRARLSAKAYAHTSAYDKMITTYLSEKFGLEAAEKDVK